MNIFGSSSKKGDTETTTITETTTNIEDSRRAVTDDGVLLESGSNLGTFDRSTNIAIENVSDEIAIQAIRSNSQLGDTFLDNSLSVVRDLSFGVKEEANRANALATKFFDETARINKQQAFGLEGEILGNVKTVVLVGIALVGLYFITRGK